MCPDWNEYGAWIWSCRAIVGVEGQLTCVLISCVQREADPPLGAGGAPLFAPQIDASVCHSREHSVRVFPHSSAFGSTGTCSAGCVHSKHATRRQTSAREAGRRVDSLSLEGLRPQCAWKDTFFMCRTGADFPYCHLHQWWSVAEELWLQSDHSWPLSCAEGGVRPWFHTISCVTVYVHVAHDQKVFCDPAFICSPGHRTRSGQSFSPGWNLRN